MRMFAMPGKSYAGPLPPLTVEEWRIREGLHVCVHHLSDTIGERNIFRPAALEAAAGYLRRSLANLAGEMAEQSFDAMGQRVANLELTRGGAERADEIVVLGAHYDTVPGCPGANDNATGVAALLEIARLLETIPLPRTIRFVAFVNEEPPFFQTQRMGSRQYARRCHERAEKVVAMFSLETIGCYSDVPGSQQYPFPFGRFYPDVGNFIGFVGNLASADLVRRSIGSFRRHTAFPTEGIAAPGWIGGIGWSDQWSFWQEGYAAIMVTDTAPYRYPYYHTADDTAEKIDYERTARVAAGLARVVAEAAGAPPFPPIG